MLLLRTDTGLSGAEVRRTTGKEADNGAIRSRMARRKLPVQHFLRLEESPDTPFIVRCAGFLTEAV